MKIICEKNDLLIGLSTVLRALSARTTIPALEGVVIETKNASLQFTAFDMVLAIESVIQAEVIEEGKVLLPGRLLTEVIRKMPEGQVTVSVENGKAIISAENAQTTVSAMNLDEFPALPAMEEGVRLTVPQKVLKSLVFKSCFAVAIDESRPILNGILLEIKPESIKAVALDGYRLATAEVSVRTNMEMNVVIPGHSLIEAAKLLGDEEQIDIFIQKKHVLLDLGHTKVISRLLEGEFIRYQNIIPQDFVTEVVVNRKMLEESIDRAALIARENKTNVIVMTVKENKMIVTAKAETGNAYEEVPASVFGKDIEIAFNSKYIIDCLKAVEDEFVKFYFKTNLSPSIIKAAEERGEESYLYLVLPIRM